MHSRLAILALLPQLAVASTLGTVTNVGFTTGSPACGGLGVACSGSVTVPGTTAQMAYVAYGVSNIYGTLGAYAQGNITPGVVTGTPPTYGNIAAEGYFVDTFTFTGTDTCGGVPCAATGSGTIEMQFLLDGTQTSSGNAFASYCMDFEPGNTLPINCNIRGYPLLVSQRLSIVFGQATTFSVGLIAYGHLMDFTDPNVSFTSNFGATATLAGFVVDDSNGKPLSSFSVTSTSGTLYPDTAVPEPASFLMLGAAIPLIAAWRRSCGCGETQALLISASPRSHL